MDLKSGTSMACPIVAGVCGLIKSINPGLTPAQVIDIIKTTAKNIDSYNPNYIGKIGAGCIDAYASVLKANGGNTTLKAEFKASKTSIITGESVDFTDQSTGSPTQWVWNSAVANHQTLWHKIQKK